MSGIVCGARRERLIAIAAAAVAGLAFCTPGARALTFAQGADYPLPDPSSAAPSYAGVAVGDLNGDGKPEIMVPREDTGKLWVFPNKGDGTFAAAMADTSACPNGSPYPAFGLQSPGGNPFLVLDCTGSQFELLPGDGNGGFGAPIVNPVQPTNADGGMAIGTVDFDGQQDLVYTLSAFNGSSQSQGVCWLKISSFTDTPTCSTNTGFSQFRQLGNHFALVHYPSTPGHTQDVVNLADPMHIGSIGYGLYEEQNPDPVWSEYSPIPTNATGGQVDAAGDLNGDGTDDVVVANSSGSTSPGTLYSLLYTSGSGYLPSMLAASSIPDPTYMQLADFNGDGKLDAIVAGTDNSTPGGAGITRNPEFAVMLGHGDGTFDAPQVFSTGFSPDSTAWWLGVGDLNGDGKPDVVIANGDEQTVRVFLNTTPVPSGGGGGGGGSGTGGGGTGGGTGGGGGGGPNPTAVVTLASLHASTLKFHIGKALVRFTRSVPVGTTISFSVSSPARVTFTFIRLTNGKRSGRRCVRPTPKLQLAPACTLRTRAGSLSFNATAGSHKLSFDGRLSRRKALRPGRYELDVTATANGLTSQPQKLLLTLLPQIRH